MVNEMVELMAFEKDYMMENQLVPLKEVNLVLLMALMTLLMMAPEMEW